LVLRRRTDGTEFLKPRDIFDVAVVLTDSRILLEGKLSILSSVRNLLVKRLQTLPQAYYRQAIEELDILAAWDNLKPSALPRVIALVDKIP
jgi:hypothetical protein